MNRNLKVSLALAIFLLTGGCNFPTREPQVDLLPTQPPAVIEQTSTAVPTEPIEPTELPPTQTAEPEIVHVLMPNDGSGQEQTIHDQLSQEVAPEQRAYGGDEYVNGRWERPFMAEGMEYLPFIDIVQTNLIREEDTEWLYADIILVESPSTAGERDVIYGIEVDKDLDGRGDVLILVNAPASTEWTTDGVYVWQDLNANVGGEDPMRPNAPEHGDGYEVMIFEEGKGDDADLAWVRLSPELENKVEIAFKLDLMDIGEDYYFFLWGAWAFVEDANPGWFDHHDKFTLEEAGSPLKENDHYPLKAFYAADNTCRALSGLEVTSQLPGMCPVSVPQASGGEDEPSVGRCPPENCCPSATVACNSHWDYATCSCVPNN